MTTVELGTNRLVDCRAVVGYQGADLLAVETNPLRVSLRVPSPDPTSGYSVEVADGKVVTGEGISISAEERSFAIYMDETLLAVALLRDGDTIHLKVDLRSLGLQIFDDARGLHIGSAVFGKNVIQGAAVAFGLG